MNFVKSYLQLKVKSRLFVSIAVVIGFSMILTFWSFYGFFSLMKSGSGDVTSVYLSEFLKKPKNAAQYPKIAKQFLNWEALSSLSGKKKKLVQPIKYQKLVKEEEDYLYDSITGIDSLSWSQIYSFVIKTSNHATNFHFRKTRDITRFVCDYILDKKMRDKNFDSTPYFSAVIKMISMFEINDRILISKMVAMACQKYIAETVHGLYVKQLLSGKEKMAIVTLLNQMIETQLTFEQTMWGEYQFSSRAMLQFYKKAPLACYILEMIFGDPIKQFKELLSGGFVMSSEDFMAKNRHILLNIAVPNFRKARIKVREFEVLTMCLLNELTGKPGDNRYDKRGVVFIKEKDNKNDITTYYATFPSIEKKEGLKEVHFKLVDQAGKK